MCDDFWLNHPNRQRLPVAYDTDLIQYRGLTIPCSVSLPLFDLRL